MKKYKHIFMVAIALLMVISIDAQTTTTTTRDTVEANGVTTITTTTVTVETIIDVGKSLGLYIFPAKGQDKATQKADEMECYRWAAEASGVDPLNIPDIEAEQVATGPDGSAVRGAARGAAAGAAIGAIAGDAGKGAAIGATAGAIRGRRASRYGRAVQQEQNEAAANAKEQEMLDNFKKAFSACIEGKGYSVN
ncbi:glycine zipper family protein [Carboxylicivirga sp. M1479]|uniref:glycine zipper family protein n=1 Tax=Carboxylicivirga sp. M1479 TaxID=2594476 RepID=UPI001C8F6924|nr:glycine zipper family protein [Carboxylicivirga sp. M1479]